MEKFLDKVNAAVASGNPMTGVTPTATPPSDLDVDMKMADVGGIPFTQIRGVNGNPSFAERLLNAQSGQSSFSQRLQGVLDNHAFAADTVNRGDLARGFAAAGMLQGDRGSQGFWKDLGMSILSAPCLSWKRSTLLVDSLRPRSKKRLICTRVKGSLARTGLTRRCTWNIRSV